MTRAVFQLQNPDNGTAPTTAAEVTVTGEIDVTNVDEFTRSVLDVPGPRPIILQLSGVKYLDSAGFAALGGIINLTVEDNSVRFEVNQLAAERAGLKISSKLLGIAKIVKEQDQGRKN